MRSIRYLLFGKPCKIDDCLDLSKHKTQVVVHIDLAAEQFATDQTILVQLAAKFHWQFEDCQIAFDEVCGAFFFWDNLKTISSRIAKANVKLQRLVDMIEARNICVLYRDKMCFDSQIIAEGNRM